MRKLIFVLSCWWAGAAGAATAPLSLFGVPLEHATRAQVEGAMDKAGLTPLQVGKKFWYDIYRVHGQLPGASQLMVGYTKHNRFAVARYVFPSFMDTGQVTKIIDMVKEKYGPPSSRTGMAGLGVVTATWREPGGMEIRVVRGWPATTTTLSLLNPSMDARMKAQIAAEKAHKLDVQARADSNAF